MAKRQLRDFNGDGRSDILWRGSDGSVAQWQMAGGAGYLGYAVQANLGNDWQVVDSRGDYNGDGKSDILWMNDPARTWGPGSPYWEQRQNPLYATWEMLGGSRFLGQEIGYMDRGQGNGISRLNYHLIEGHGDFNGDGRSDLAWQHANNGAFATAEMLGGSSHVTYKIDEDQPRAQWSVISIGGDYNNDGRADVLNRHDDGTVRLWEMQGGGQKALRSLQEVVPLDWTILSGDSDLTGDGRSDLLWRHTDGTIALWEMQGGNAFVGRTLQSQVGADWRILDARGDYNGDGLADLLWRSTDGAIATWELGLGGTFTGRVVGQAPGALADGHADFNGDGKSDLLFMSANGTVTTWEMAGGAAYTAYELGVIAPASWHLTDSAEPGGILNGQGLTHGTLGADYIVMPKIHTTDGVIGDAGRDTFVFDRWSSEGDVITDFEVGPLGDILDLRWMYAVAPRTGFLEDSPGNEWNPPHDGTAFSAGWVRFVPSGNDTIVQIDPNGGSNHGGGDVFYTLVTLTNAVLTQGDTLNYLI
jgi:hypothetical protein